MFILELQFICRTKEEAEHLDDRLEKWTHQDGAHLLSATITNADADLVEEARELGILPIDCKD